MVDASPRQQLLEAAVARVLAHGIGDLSLRALADELGTSHRMLIFHFGSKEQLWGEIVHAVERRQRARLADLLPDLHAAPHPARSCNLVAPYLPA